MLNPSSTSVINRFFVRGSRKMMRVCVGPDRTQELLEYLAYSRGVQNFPKDLPKKPFIAVGMPRSGSTLFARLLNEHPLVRCLSEPYREWVVHGSIDLDASGTEESSVAQGKAPWYRHPSHLISELLRSAQPDEVTGFKETFLKVDESSGQFVRSLHAQNKVNVIAIIRDPRAIWASLQRYMARSFEGTDAAPSSDGENWWDGAPEWYPRRWMQFVEWVETNDVPYVRYEDIARDPSTTLKPIFRAIGLPPHELSGLSQNYSGLGDDKALNSRNVHTQSLTSFRSHLPESTIEVFNQVCGDHMSRFDYTL